MVFLGFWDRDVVTTACYVVTLAFCLELATQEGFFILEVIILMLCGFLMTLVGVQIRRVLYRAP